MKQLISIFSFTCICLSLTAQTINIHVTKLNWQDQDFNSNEIIDSEVGQEVEAYYTFDLKKNKLHYVNELRGIDIQIDLLGYTFKNGVYTINYKDSDIDCFTTVVIDVDNHKVNMTFHLPQNNITGYDTFTDFDVSLK